MIKSAEEENNFWESMRNSNKDHLASAADDDLGSAQHEGVGGEDSSVAGPVDPNNSRRGFPLSSGGGGGRGRGGSKSNDGGRGTGAKRFNGQSHGKAYHDRQRALKAQDGKGNN